MVLAETQNSNTWAFSYSEIVSITENFKTIIGGGGFGKVFFGTLKDGTQVAIKLLSQSSRQGYKEFQAEVSCSTLASPVSTHFNQLYIYYNI